MNVSFESMEVWHMSPEWSLPFFSEDGVITILLNITRLKINIKIINCLQYNQ